MTPLKRSSLKWWDNTSQSQSGLNFSHAQKIKNLDIVLGGHVFNDMGYRYLETEERERFNVNLRYNFKKIAGLSIGVNTNMMQYRGGLFVSLQYTTSCGLIGNSLCNSDFLVSGNFVRVSSNQV